jgi:hypothetical protein
MHRPTIVAACALVTLAGLAAPSLASITVTRADRFNPGWFFPNFTYAWTINAAPAKGVYNDYEVTGWTQWPTWVDQSTYVGPGSIGGPQPLTGFRVQTTNVVGFGRPLSGQIDSVSNPKVVQGKLRFTITRNGIVLNTVLAALAPIEPNATTVAGSTTVTFPPGAFLPGTVIDLFQTTSLAAFDCHLGAAGTALDGSLSVSLNRPLLNLDVESLCIGVDGLLMFEIPSPGTFVLFASGLVLSARRRRHA